MTTLTPESALERLIVHTAMEDAAVAMECEAILKPVIAALSTQRQASEAAQNLLADRSTELDWERSARQAAEKEVERERLWKREANTKLSSAEAKLAALPPIVAGLRFDLRMQCEFGPDFHQAIKDNLDKLAALSALPPPVPKEEAKAERADLVTVVENLGVPEWRVQIGDVLLCYGESRADAVKIGERIEVAIRDRLAAPTQAPQDVAGLVEDVDALFEDAANQWGDPHTARHARASWAQIKAALRPSPISHESKGLELAAADNNHKALVEALEPFAAIQPSSLYPADGSEAEGYAAFLEGDRPMFTGADLARARDALASITTKETEQ